MEWNLKHSVAQHGNVNHDAHEPHRRERLLVAVVVESENFCGDKETRQHDTNLIRLKEHILM